MRVYLSFCGLFIAGLLLLSSSAYAAPIGPDTTGPTPEEIAQEYLRMNRADLAIETLTKALAKTNVPRLHYWLGIARAQNGEPDRAEAEFRTVLTDDPEFIQAHFRIVEITLRRISLSQPKDKNLKLLETAIRELEAAIKKNPVDTKVYYDAAGLYVDTARFREQNPEAGFSEALRILEEARKRTPEEVRPYVGLGNIRTRQVDFLAGGKPLKDLAPDLAKRCGELLDAATADFKKALAVDPHFLAALNRIAAIHEAKGNLKEALKTLEDHIAKVESMMEKATCYRWMGQYLMRSQDWAPAEEKLNTALKTEPKDLASYLLLSNVLLQRNFPAQAIETLQKSLKENPNFLNAYVELGILELRQRRDLTNASQHFQDALNLPPGRAVVVSSSDKPVEGAMADLYTIAAIQLGDILVAQGKFDEAIVTYRRLATIIPNSPVPEFRIGEVYRVKQEYDLAKEHYDNALRRDPNFVEARARAADMEYLKIRVTAGAQERAKILNRVIEQYLLALESMPANASIIDHLADLHYQLAALSTPKDRTALDKAVDFSKKATAAAPDAVQFRRRLAFLHHELGSNTDAAAELKKIIDDTQKILDKDAANITAIFLIADTRTVLHSWQPDKDLVKQALDGFALAVEKQPSFFQGYLSAALLLEREKDYAPAAEWYKKLLQAAKGDNALGALPAENARYVLHAAAELAWLFCESIPNKLDEADKYAKMATELDANLSSLVDTLGWILYKKGQFTEALPFLRRAYNSAPANATVGYHLGATLIKTNNPDRAKEILQESLKQVGDDADMKQKIQALLKSLGV